MNGVYMKEKDPVEETVNEEALKRWIADGWLEEDFEEKGFTYRRKVLQDWLMPDEHRIL